MSDPVHLSTHRLLLRPWRPTDRDTFAAMNADPDVMRHFPQPLDPVASDSFADRIEAHFATHGYGLWAVQVVDGPEFIGFVGLNPMPAGVPGAGGMEIGWRLARVAWGHGYATEAATEALRFALEDLRLAPVWSMTALANQPSIAVMRRIGLHEHSRADHPRFAAGHPLRPHAFYRTS